MPGFFQRVYCKHVPGTSAKQHLFVLVTFLYVTLKVVIARVIMIAQSPSANCRAGVIFVKIAITLSKIYFYGVGHFLQRGTNVIAMERKSCCFSSVTLKRLVTSLQQIVASAVGCTSMVSNISHAVVQKATANET